MKLCFIIVLVIVVLMFQPVIAQPLPPSEHILSYEEFVSSNIYAGEFVSVNAKIDRIERGDELDWYRIRLVSLEGKAFSNIGWVRVDHSWGFEFFEGKMLIRDVDIGIALDKGDNIVIVGKADRIIGMNREMHVNEGGTVILLLNEYEYKKERDVRGGRLVREFSFTFDVVESYEIVDGELKKNRKVERRKFFALGDYDISLLVGNYDLLDGDGDRLMSPIDPFPDTKDKDGDGLDDKEEMEFGTHPQLKDSDREGISDYEEVKGKLGVITNPLSKDTDGDRLTDYKELFGFEVAGVTYRTNPLKRDTDGDGKIDSVDDRPSEPEKLIDTDGDGLSDIEEKEIGTSIHEKDTDGDDLTDFEEVRGTIGYKTDPLMKDTDGDGLSDKEEVNMRLNPKEADTDFDGLSDKKELDMGTNPKNPDTDGDGIIDPEDRFPLFNNNLIYGLSGIPVLVILLLSIIHLKNRIKEKIKEVKEARKEIEELKEKIFELAEEKYGDISLKEVEVTLGVDSKTARSFMKELIRIKIAKKDKKDRYSFPEIMKKYAK